MDRAEHGHAGVLERLRRHARGIAAIVVAAGIVSALDVVAIPGPPWVLPAIFLVLSVAIATAYAVFPTTSGRDVHVRAAIQATSLTLVTYVTGWGFALPMVHLLGEADNIQTASTTATRRTWWWGVVTTAAGQVAVALGLLPSAVRNITATHVVAAFSLLVAYFVRGRLRRAVHQRELTQQEVVSQALRDDLTGLGNRAALIARLETLGRDPDHAETPVLLHLNIDGFRTINDTLGHEIGDRILRAVGRRIQGMLRSPDAGHRLSGDDFGVLLGDTTPGEAVAVARRLLAGLDRQYRIGERTVVLGVRCGIAPVETGTAATDALRHADMAVSSLRDDDVGRIAHYDERLAEQLTARLSLQQDLAIAVHDDALHLHFQPLVNMADGVVVGAEALCRWEHPVRGPIRPDEFIPLAEQGGLIVRLGRFVLGEACAQMVRWQDEVSRSRFAYVSVNVSMYQVRGSDVVADVRLALEQSGLHPSALTIEFTESALVDDPEALIGAMEGLRALGVRLSVDDFGTGYSSLAYLDRLPVHVIKVDRAFVLSAQESRRGVRLLGSIIEMVQALGLETVVEGIETEVDAEVVRSLGGTTAQGYLYGRPTDAAGLSALLRTAPDRGGRERTTSNDMGAPPDVTPRYVPVPAAHS